MPATTINHDLCKPINMRFAEANKATPTIFAIEWRAATNTMDRPMPSGLQAQNASAKMQKMTNQSNADGIARLPSSVRQCR